MAAPDENKILLLIISAIVLVAFPTAMAEPIVIKFSHVVAVDTPKGQAAEYFKKLAEKRTNGEVTIQVYPNSQLYKDKEEMEVKGIRGPAYWDNGFRAMSANSPLRIPADFKGLKMRIQSSKILDAQKMFEVQKYVTVSNRGYLGYAVIVNKKFWESLSSEIRTQLESAMADAADFANSIAKQKNEEGPPYGDSR